MKKIFIAIVTIVSLPMSAQTYNLEQILDSARQNNIAMRTAQHNIEAAQQQRKEAFTKYFPKVSAEGAWFNATKDMAEMTVNPSEMLSPQVAADLAQVLPASALAALATPTSISMLKDGVLAGVTAVQPVFAGGQIVNGNRLAKVGEEVSQMGKPLAAATLRERGGEECRAVFLDACIPAGEDEDHSGCPGVAG